MDLDRERPGGTRAFMLVYVELTLRVELFRKDSKNLIVMDC